MSTETKTYDKILGSQHLYVKPKNNNFKRNVIVFLASMFAVILLVIGAVSFLADAGFAKDSGVSACEQMAKNAGKQGSGAKMTDQQRMEKRAPFANSKYADLRVAGTGLVDAVYEMDQKVDDADLPTSMAILTTLQSKYTSLQTACSAHGVSIPNLPTVK